MANINVTVNSNDLFSIALDMWEWTGLTVNGSTVTPINIGEVQFQYNQSVAGSIHFVATATQDIVLVNSGTTLFMKSPDGTKTYMLILSYSEVNSVITLNGHLSMLPFLYSDAKPSPLTFSQGRMTGNFQISTISTGAIQINNQYFFTAVNNGGLGKGQNVAIRTDARVVGPREKFRLIPLSSLNSFALKTPDDLHYVTAVNNGGMGGPNNSTSPIHTDAVVQGPWETFSFEQQPDGSYAIQTSAGYYLSAVDGGGWGEGSNSFPVHTDATVIGPWETFNFVGTMPH